jgi:hypothetical protein
MNRGIAKRGKESSPVNILWATRIKGTLPPATSIATAVAKPRQIPIGTLAITRKLNVKSRTLAIARLSFLLEKYF